MRFDLRWHTLISLRPGDLDKLIPCGKSPLLEHKENGDVDSSVKKWLRLADHMLAAAAKVTP